MIAVIDYGIGNVSSIVNMLKKVGVEAKLIRDVMEIEAAEKIILPGVGAFDSGMQKLKEKDLVNAIKRHAIVEHKPLLGICLGMQMLGRNSEEGIENGLNLIPFECKRFMFSEEHKSLKIPHMGWDMVNLRSKNDPILQDMDDMQRYYFVHSYHAVCDSEDNILMTCDYGYQFTAAVKYKNIYGVQFHPEKSHKYGMILLNNFARSV